MRGSRPAWLFAFVATLVFICAASPGYAEKVRVLVSETFAPEIADFAERYADFEIVTFKNGEELIEKVPGCHAIVGLSPAHPTAEIVRAGKDLKWIQVSSAGLERYLEAEELVKSDIVLTSAKIIQGPEIADHAFGLLLNLTRDIKFFNEQMKDVGFERRSRLPLIELRGKTGLIIGLGGIGTQIAERAHAFGMRVIAVDPKDIPIMGAIEYVGKPDELNRLLPEADVVFSSVPLTRESKGMIGEKQFDLMKEGVYFINVSRGGIVDTDALVAALKSGKVRAAGVDVTDPEPLPKDHPLWSMPNVTVTPHLATSSDGLPKRRLRLFRDNIERFITGRPLRNVVDKVKGY